MTEAALRLLRAAIVYASAAAVFTV